MKVSKNEIIKIFLENSDFCIYTHIKPDGDAVGSAFGLAIALQALGKRVTIKCQDPWPKKFRDLIDVFSPDDIENEVGVAVDASSLSRLGDYAQAKISVCIDHHKSNDCSIDKTYLEENAISCSSIIFNLLEGLFTSIPQKAREFLFIGLLTDSDGFKSSEVDSQTFIDAGRIASTDINPAILIKKYYATKSLVELQCEKVVLDNISFYFDNSVTISFLPKDMLQKMNFEGTDALSSLVAKIAEVELGVTIFEKSESIYSISIRSNGNWDSSVLAVALGGGGHKSAAGATVSEISKDELIKKINDIIAEKF